MIKNLLGPQIGMNIGSSIGLGGLPQQSRVMPQQAPMTKMFPGIDEDEEEVIISSTSNITDPDKKMVEQQRLYRETLRIKNEAETIKNRASETNSMIFNQINADSETKPEASLQAGLAQFGDSLRAEFWDLKGLSDDEIRTKFKAKHKDADALMASYVNEGKEDIFIRAGVKQPDMGETLEGIDFGGEEWANMTPLVSIMENPIIQTTAGILGAKTIGDQLKNFGRFIYGTAFRELQNKTGVKQIKSPGLVKSMFDKAWDFMQQVRTGKKPFRPEPTGEQLPGVRETGLRTTGIWGTVKGIGQSAYKEQKIIWNELSKYIPKNSKIVTSVGLEKEIIEKIDELGVSSFKKNRLLSELSEFMDDFFTEYPNGMSADEAHKFTSELGEEIGSAFKSKKGIGGVPTTNEYKAMLMEVRSVLRNRLYQSMTKVAQTMDGGTITQKRILEKFNQYGMLGEIVNQADKTLQSKVIGGPLGLQSAAMSQGLAPAATMGGKSIYNIGAVLTTPFNVIKGGGKKVLNILLKGGKGLLSPVNMIDPIDAILGKDAQERTITSNFQNMLNGKGVFKGVSEDEVNDFLITVDLDAPATAATNLSQMFNEQSTYREVLPKEIIEYIENLQFQSNIMNTPRFKNTTISPR